MAKTTVANRWPYLLLILGLVFFAVTGWSVYRSVIGVSAVTDRHYYSHGLRYNDSLVEQKAAESFGWQVAVSLQNGSFTTEWRDKDGQPVVGGEIRLVLSAKDRSQIILRMQGGESGFYDATLPSELRGEVQALLTLNHDGATLRRPLLLNL